MEATFGGKAHHPHLYGTMVPDLRAVGKKSSLEWDLNDWRWDADLLTATPLNPLPADCGSRRFVDLSNSSSSFSDDPERGGVPRDLEKRRRDTVVAEEEDGGECLRLGGLAFPIADGEVKSGKKSKLVVADGTGLRPSSSRAVCQVEDCGADLSNAKDYHRRHKVCNMHSKASKALVGNIMQRFCQQCSRYSIEVLQCLKIVLFSCNTTLPIIFSVYQVSCNLIILIGQVSRTSRV